jgi:hypothetical protein
MKAKGQFRTCMLTCYFVKKDHIIKKEGEGRFYGQLGIGGRGGVCQQFLSNMSRA